MADTKSAWSWAVDTGLGSFVGGGLANLAGNLLGRLPYLRDDTPRQISNAVVKYGRLATERLARSVRELIRITNMLRGLDREQDTQIQHLETQNQYLEAQNQLLRDQNLLLQTQNTHLGKLSGSTGQLVKLMEEQINSR